MQLAEKKSRDILQVKEENEVIVTLVPSMYGLYSTTLLMLLPNYNKLDRTNYSLKLTFIEYLHTYSS